MDINKRTILWIVFAVSLFFLWNDWMVSNGKQSMFSMTPPPKVATAPSPVVPASTVPGASAGAVPGVVADPAALKSQIITVTTDVFKVDIDTAGGVVRRLELLKFKEATHPGWLGGCFGLSPACKTNRGTEKNELLFDQGDGKTYLAQTGLLGAAGLPNHNTIFAAKPGVRTLDNGNMVQVVLEANQGGVKLTKTFTFKRGDYVIDVRHDVTNTGAVAVAPSLYLQLLHDGTKPVTDGFFNSSYTGPTLYTSTDHYEKLTFENIEKGKDSHATKATDGWIAISQHFFVSAFIPPANAPREIRTEKVATNLYSISTVQPLGTVAPGATVSSDARLYSGPQDEARLEQVAPKLDLVKDYVWATFIAKPIFRRDELPARYPGQLGLDDRRVHHFDQAAVLPAVGCRLPQHGQDESRGAEDDRDPREIQKRSGQDEPGHDGAVQERKDQPAGRLPADPGADAGVPGPVLGAAVVGRVPRRAVDPVDPGFVGA